MSEYDFNNSRASKRKKEKKNDEKQKNIASSIQFNFSFSNFIIERQK